MQRLRIAILICTCLIPTAQSNYAASRHADKTKSQQPSIQPAPVTLTVEDHKKTPEETAEEKRQSDHDNSIKTVEIILTVVIAVAATVQAFAAIAQWLLYKKQSKLMLDSLRLSRIATNTAKSSVDIARDGLEAMVNKERPRIFVEIMKSKDYDGLTLEGSARVHFKIVYAGQTEAFIKRAWATATLEDSREMKETSFQVPFSLPNPIKENVLDLAALIVNKLTFKLPDLDGLENKGSKFIHFQGAIFYTDAFEREHVTKFGHVYGVSSIDLPTLDGHPYKTWTSSGPEFNQNT